ncbi:MAG: cellulase family glycosylhydrolase [Methylacidiphilales bacterium]|nr:cellulase family glycosylhydrolase [Candidatus Methylacidiphilales bacterium]
MNYTPTRAWWHCWNDFQSDAIAKDLDAIVRLGADHIRIMLIWPYFQPNPKVVSKAHLDRLEILMNLAEERQLDVCVSLFVGWLSGYAFKPPFQPDSSFYQLLEERSIQEFYVTSIAKAMSQHSNFLGFDLGNELNCCWQTDDLDCGDRWSSQMLALSEKCLPGGTHVNGVDHNPWFTRATFSPQCLATTQSIIPLHCWTFFTGALGRAGGNCFDPRCLRLPEAMAALARSYSGNPRKPIWIQEYGMSEDWTDPENIPRFLQESTVNAIQSGVNWFTWWSSHDLDRQYAFHPLEYSLGLITLDQKIKVQGHVFKELADAYRGRNAVDTKQINLATLPQMQDADSTWKWLENWIGISELAKPGAADRPPPAASFK